LEHDSTAGSESMRQPGRGVCETPVSQETRQTLTILRWIVFFANFAIAELSICQAEGNPLPAKLPAW
jgi:hypothetical protein